MSEGSDWFREVVARRRGRPAEALEPDTETERATEKAETDK